MTGETQAVAEDPDPSFELVVSDEATPEWLAAWTHCDARLDVDEHVRTVFPRMAGMARFAHAGDRACGISVELDGIIGLFCIAVAPEARRQGLGKQLVRSMLAQHDGPLTYLQVFSENEAGVALYTSLGFREEYRYCHCVMPGSGPAAGAGSAGGAAAAYGGGC
jgi:ribosomal protein S18 acetylase RimI-like enzyme